MSNRVKASKKVFYSYRFLSYRNEVTGKAALFLFFYQACEFEFSGKIILDYVHVYKDILCI